MSVHFIFGLLGALLYKISCLAIPQSEFILKYPDQPIQFPNISIALILRLENDDPLVQIESAGSAMTMICQLEKFNEKTNTFVVNGIFNALIYSLDSQSNYEHWSLLQKTIAQNLYFANDTSRTFGAIPNTPINAIIQSSTANQLDIDFRILAGSSIPSISIISSEFVNEEDNLPTAQKDQSSSYGTVVISQVSSSVLATNIFNVLEHFNWTLVAAIFSTDKTGFIGQNAIQDVSLLYQNVTFSCTATLDAIDSPNYQTDVDEVSSCILSSNIVRAMIIWMNPEDAIVATDKISQQVGSIDNLVFIYPRMTEELALTKAPVSSMYFEASLDSIPDDEPFSCSDSARKKMIDALGPELVDMATKTKGNCLISDPSLPVCDEFRRDETLCTCPNDEPYYTAFASDSVTLLMRAVYNLQSNCSALNECIATNYKNYKQDFCSISSFTGEDLFFATRCSPIFGQSGLISFTNRSIVRATIPMNLLQVQNESNIVIIGNLNNLTDTYFNNDFFVGGQVPISSIVVDDQSLSNSSIVDVFFAINAVLFVITIGLAIYVFMKRNHRVIRNSSAMASYIVLLGLIFVELSVVFMCVSSSTASCTLIDVFLLLGISLIIAILMAKTYRIYRIFQNPTAEAVRITDKHLLLFTAAICVGTIILMVLYDALGGGLVPITKTAELNPLYLYTICEVKNSTIQLTFLIIFYAYFILLFVIAGVLAFMTRKTMIDFNESWDVGFIVYSWLAITVIYAPLYYLQGDSTNSNQTIYTIRFIAIALAIILTILILFAKKIKLIYISEKHERARRLTAIET